MPAFRAVPGSPGPSAPGRAEGPPAPPPGRRGGMAASARWVLCLCLGWGCLCLALGDALRPRRVGLRRRAAPGAERAGRVRATAGDDGPGQRRPGRSPAADRVAEHMLRLYEQYRGSQDPPTPPESWFHRGNTVRGFRPLPAGECAPWPGEEGGHRRGRAWLPMGSARPRGCSVFPERRASEHRWGSVRRPHGRKK